MCSTVGLACAKFSTYSTANEYSDQPREAKASEIGVNGLWS